MPARQTPKVEALVVNAIRRLQDVQGSTSREISNYISQEYDVPGKEIRRQVQLALQRGLSYGILQRSKGGYYSCNHDYLGQLSLGYETGDGVMEPCPSQPWRFGVRKRRLAKRRRQRAQRKRRRREKRERQACRRRNRKNSRRSRDRAKRLKSEERRRRRRQSRTRRRRRRGRRRRGRRRRGRGRSRGRERVRRCAESPGEMEMIATASGLKENGVSQNGDSQKSGTSISERLDEQYLQNSQTSNVSDDI